MNEHDDDTFARFERRFRAIEAQVPDRELALRPGPVRPRSRIGLPSLVAAMAVLVILAALVLAPRSPRPSEPAAASAGPSASPTTPGTAAAPSATPRAIRIGDEAWTVACDGASDEDCDGAVGLFANNLAWSWQRVLDGSGGRLTVEPRACPTFRGLTGRACWDITAVLPEGPFCMVVGHDASDPRYPAYFELGGQDGAGRAMWPPADWPMCLAASR